jgi:hypothetical protein
MVAVHYAGSARLFCNITIRQAVTNRENMQTPVLLINLEVTICKPDVK